jgi:hypothetical protein
LSPENRAHAVGGGLAGAGVAEVLDEALDLSEREADGLELHDPVDAVDRGRAVEAEPTLGATGRLEQAQLLVEVHRPDGLADHLGELSDAEQFVVRFVHVAVLIQTLT